MSTFVDADVGADNRDALTGRQLQVPIRQLEEAICGATSV